MENQSLQLSVSEFIALTNQVLEGAYPSVELVGEVSSFKVNQGKFVFFDLKDAESSVGCFMMLFALRQPIEDGMKVVVRAQPKLTKWGKFSLTVQSIRPSGEGSLKKSFELLKAKLSKEGLFAPEKKRTLPLLPRHVGVISSTGAAGYADFMKIIDERWGGVSIDVANVQVQGEVAPMQILRALEHFNQQESLPEVIIIIRGGGSADDLAAFNDEPLVRAVAASRIPVLTGIGHEVDESLVDLAADVRASTPSNAAERLVPDKREVLAQVRGQLRHITSQALSGADGVLIDTRRMLERVWDSMNVAQDNYAHRLEVLRLRAAAYDPEKVLARGYAVVRGQARIGAELDIETAKERMKAEVTYVEQKV